MDITSTVMDNFRQYFDEFSNKETYSDNLVLRCLHEADMQTQGALWGNYTYTSFQPNTKALGLFYYAAHRLVLASAAKAQVEAGAAPASNAAITSQSVGDESISYQRGSLAARDEGLFSTGYGQDFYNLRESFGFAGFQI